jgi:hypothetical protein
LAAESPICPGATGALLRATVHRKNLEILEGRTLPAFLATVEYAGGAVPQAVAPVDLRSGGVIAFLEFQTAVEEIFVVQLLLELRFPAVIGFQQQTIQHTFVVPPGLPDLS